VSVAVGTPLLARLMPHGEAVAHGRRAGTATALVGFVLLTDGVAHLILAATLPTITFLSVSRLVTIGELALLVLGRRLLARPAARDGGGALT
jgi:hypothetical protein